MNKIKTYCVSNIVSNNLKILNLNLVGVGKKEFPAEYLNCKTGINIQSKERYYSELTFHYWFWKNMLENFDTNHWIGFCQKRRFWLKEDSKEINNIFDLKENILREIPKKWEHYDAFLCTPIKVSPLKKMKLIKRGWRNLIKDPTILFDTSKQNINLQFDMFHGYGILDRAIDIMKTDHREKFRLFVNSKTEFNPHIMMISKKKILNNWFQDLFEWLFNCEKLFGFKNLVGYDSGRLYAYLSERYLSFWFSEFCNSRNNPWIFFDPTDKFNLSNL